MWERNIDLFSLYASQPGSNLQSGYMSWPIIKPTIFQYLEWHANKQTYRPGLAAIFDKIIVISAQFPSLGYLSVTTMPIERMITTLIFFCLWCNWACSEVDMWPKRRYEPFRSVCDQRVNKEVLSVMAFSLPIHGT